MSGQQQGAVVEVAGVAEAPANEVESRHFSGSHGEVEFDVHCGERI